MAELQRRDWPALATPAPLSFKGGLVAAACFAALIAAVHYAHWWPGGATTLGWDMLSQYWGDLAFHARHLAQGELPAWNPYERLGYPIYADPQAGQLYPPNWLLYPLAWLGDGMPWWAPLIKAWLHLTAGATGMYAFLHRREGRLPALVGALIFTLAVPTVLNLASALLWPLAWLPWVLLALDRTFERPSPRAGAWLGLALGGAVLAGAPQSLLMVLLCATFFGVARLLEALRALPAGAYWPYARRLAVALGVGAGVTLIAGLPVLLPAPEMVEASVRATRDAEFVLKTRAREVTLSLAVPRLGLHRFHYGLFALCAAAIAIAHRPGRYLWAGLLLVMSALIAAGGDGPLLESLADVFPPFGLFRGPQRYAFLGTVAMAVAAPGGVGILLRINEKASRRRLAALLIGLGVAVGLLYAAGFQALAGQPDQRAFAWAIDLAALTIIVGVLLLKGPRGLRALAILAAVLGGLAFGSGEAYEYNRFPRPDTHHDAEVSVDALGGRLYDDHYLGFRPGARLGVRDASGYENDPLQGRRNHLILRAVHRAPQRLAHLGVTHFLRDKHPKMKNKLRLPKDDPGRAPGVHSVDGPIAPPVYVAGQVKIVPGRKALRTWLKTEPGSTAVVARDDATTELRALAERKPRPGVPGELLALQADHLTARVTGPGLAVFTETWHPDWQATVDGQPAQIHRANFDFRGVVIPSGTHTVQMDFRPAKRPWILAASAATLLLVILLLARRPRESAAS